MDYLDYRPFAVSFVPGDDHEGAASALSRAQRPNRTDGSACIAMSSTHVVYDTQSGRIISIHYGQIDTTHARRLAELYVRATHYYAGVNLAQLAILTISSNAFEPGKRYKVDANREILVEVAHGEGGVRFLSL